MVAGYAKFVGGTAHTERFHAAQFGFFDDRVAEPRADQCDRHMLPSLDTRRAADDLQDLGAHVDFTDRQCVGLRMTDNLEQFPDHDTLVWRADVIERVDRHALPRQHVR